jgi:hypothetical protein
MQRDCIVLDSGERDFWRFRDFDTEDADEIVDRFP